MAYHVLLWRFTSSKNTDMTKTKKRRQAFKRVAMLIKQEHASALKKKAYDERLSVAQIVRDALDTHLGMGAAK